MMNDESVVMLKELVLFDCNVYGCEKKMERKDAIECYEGNVDCIDKEIMRYVVVVVRLP